MALYSSYNTSQYYDEPKKQEVKPIPQEYKKPHQQTTPISEQKRRSLYAEAQAIATSITEYKGPDFKSIYRVGQRVAIQSPNGSIRTSNGRIAEIVDKNLMYIWMEDTYKDVNGNWLVDFVTDKDIIHVL